MTSVRKIQISPYGRNDNDTSGAKWVGFGGIFAATKSNPQENKLPVTSNEVRSQ
jgi:hypothetical protein